MSEHHMEQKVNMAFVGYNPPPYFMPCGRELTERFISTFESKQSFFDNFPWKRGMLLSGEIIPVCLHENKYEHYNFDIFMTSQPNNTEIIEEITHYCKVCDPECYFGIHNGIVTIYFKSIQLNHLKILIVNNAERIIANFKIDYVQALFEPLSSQLYYTEDCKDAWDYNMVFYLSNDMSCDQQTLLLHQAELQGFTISPKLKRQCQQYDICTTEIIFTTDQVDRLLSHLDHSKVPVTLNQYL